MQLAKYLLTVSKNEACDENVMESVNLNCAFPKYRPVRDDESSQGTVKCTGGGALEGQKSFSVCTNFLKMH